ncbi:hypothetical protein DSO57_1014159 [Entomophthora muscae]|uniref:Uncharacterized protein n=1 Tax=Entomophthora muscae TaxID=34485 RepID=A0ACC2TT52_9FUNG|nr:hypothetical protein DSO57_1014159 [Entomophthora muscae]
MECPQQFWIAEISIRLTHNTGTWCDKWHKGHTNKNWDTFNQDFLARFVLKNMAVNSLPPLALDHTIFPCHTKKGSKTPAKPLHSLNDLAHTVDERFVLAYPAEPLPLVAPSWKETLVNLDYLLAWYCPLLKTIRAGQSEVTTSTLSNPSEFQMTSASSSQSDLTAEIGMKPSSLPAPA